MLELVTDTIYTYCNEFLGVAESLSTQEAVLVLLQFK